MLKLLPCLLLLAFSPLLKADTFDASKPIDLKFTAVNGDYIDLSKMRGKVVLMVPALPRRSAQRGGSL
jgi:hypothetical protein